jgi:uridylate kinase
VKNSDARFIPHLTYDQVIARKLGVMDYTAITLCMENDLPLKIFNMNVHGNLLRLVQGEPVGTTITGDDHD